VWTARQAALSLRINVYNCASRAECSRTERARINDIIIIIIIIVTAKKTITKLSSDTVRSQKNITIIIMMINLIQFARKQQNAKHSSLKALQL